MERMNSEKKRTKEPGLGRLLVVFAIALILILGIGLGITSLVQKGSSRDVLTSSNSQEVSPIAAEFHPIPVMEEPAAEVVAVVPEPDEPLGPPEPVAGPPAQPVTYAEAEAAFMAGSYREAAGMFAAYIDDHPLNAWGHYMLGLSEWRAGNLHDAESAFLQALNLDPDHQKSLINVTRVRMELDEFDGALESVTKAVEADPASVKAHRVMGRVLHNLGRRNDAIDAYAGALALRDTDIWALNNYGLLLIEAERFSEAIPPLARAVEQDPGIAVIQNNLGVALERTGYFRAAAVAYADALAADSTYAKAAISKERAEGLVLTQSLPEPDLAALAQGFTVPVSGSAVASTDEIDSETEEGTVAVATTPDIP